MASGVEACAAAHGEVRYLVILQQLLHYHVEPVHACDEIQFQVRSDGVVQHRDKFIHHRRRLPGAVSRLLAHGAAAPQELPPLGRQLLKLVKNTL